MPSIVLKTQELPEDFDASVTLAGADASSKDSIMDTFPVVFVMRWLTLRSEVGWPLRQELACTDAQTLALPWRSIHCAFYHTTLTMVTQAQRRHKALAR